jgi:hypothetical protein
MSEILSRKIVFRIVGAIEFDGKWMLGDVISEEMKVVPVDELYIPKIIDGGKAHIEFYFPSEVII